MKWLTNYYRYDLWYPSVPFWWQRRYANIPAVKKPADFVRNDGKQSAGLTQITCKWSSPTRCLSLTCPPHHYPLVVPQRPRRTGKSWSISPCLAHTIVLHLHSWSLVRITQRAWVVSFSFVDVSQTSVAPCAKLHFYFSAYHQLSSAWMLSASMAAFV